MRSGGLVKKKVRVSVPGGGQSLLVQNGLLRLHGLVTAGVVGVSGGLDLDGVHPVHLTQSEDQAVVRQGEGHIGQPAVLLRQAEGEQTILQGPALEGEPLGEGRGQAALGWPGEQGVHQLLHPSSPRTLVGLGADGRTVGRPPGRIRAEIEQHTGAVPTASAAGEG